jgi:hypothetical protein
MMKKVFSYFAILPLCVFMPHITSAQLQYVRIISPQKSGALTIHASKILAAQITSRCAAAIVTDDKAQLNIELATEKMAAPESYRIINDGTATIRIVGSDERGLLYGVGKFLRTSCFNQIGFTPGLWRGISAPTAAVRGIYLASHFNNFYEAAPIEEVQKYLDELALWGVNYLVVTFPQFQFSGFTDPSAQLALTRLKKIMLAARVAGMKVGLIQVVNAGFKGTNSAYLNVPVPDALGRRGHFGINLNPGNAGAHKLLLQNWVQELNFFKTVGLDVIVFWPYDEGGCGCSQCWPWGARGFPKLCKEFSRIATNKYSGIEIVLSTWMFDTPDAGEWEGLSKFLSKDKSWANYLMADSHEDFPRYPLTHQVPGGLPLLNFPEISMWGQSPWGGYGANPLPNRLQHLWNETENKVLGGFPYSEGIYEDINKVICSQLYWNQERSTTDIVREYIAYEFSPNVVEEVAKAINIFEANHSREQIDSSAIEAFHLIEQVQQKLTPQVRTSWRWRIVFLRALIDQELFKTKGKLEGETLRKAFNELTTIYHAEKSHSMPIHPPVIKKTPATKAKKANSGADKK